MVRRVDGSSPSEGSAKAPARMGFSFRPNLQVTQHGPGMEAFTGLKVEELRLKGPERATAVLLDAVVIRSILMPAVLELFYRGDQSAPPPRLSSKLPVFAPIGMEQL